MKRNRGGKYRSIFAIILACIVSITTVMQIDFMTVKAETLTMSESAGWLESAYAKWLSVPGAKEYKAYVKKASEENWTKLDNELIRQYEGYWRVDALGLAAGEYMIKVEAVMEDGSTCSADTPVLSVAAHDRSGFAFSSSSKYGSASGAYKDDGTLKEDAQVVYVTAETAKTCKARVNGQEVTGFQAILDAKQKKNTSDSIIDFRIVGCVSASDLDKMSSGEEGIQVKGASEYTNMNVTIEGVGDDATVNGFGFLIRNCGNVEVRNFGIVNFMDDGISVDTDNCNLWIHNLDIFYGSAGGDKDQAKGDGSVDIKKSQYCTVSYNHFWDSGKCCLIDASSVSSGCADYLTYHHNWFDHSDSRHPRIRNGQNFHIYNNYYDGNSKYGVGVTTGSSAFVEANYFRNCNYPMMSSLQGTDALGDGTFSKETGGIIKSFSNHIEGANSYLPYSEDNTTEFDAYEVDSREEQVPANVTTKAGTSYSNFDTASSMYSYSVDSAEVAKAKVTGYAGRMNGGDLKWTFAESEDTNYSIIPELKQKVVNYKTSVVAIGGIVKGTSGSEQETTSSGGNTSKPSEETTAASPSSGKYEHNFKDGKESKFFTISGNINSNTLSKVYNGVTYTKALKMEKSTSISFTAGSKAHLIIVTDAAASKKIKIDGTECKTDSNGIYEADVETGTHTITKGDTMNVFYMSVTMAEAPTEATTQAPTEKPTEATTQAPTQKPTEGTTQAPTETPTQAPGSDFSMNVSYITKQTFSSNYDYNGFTILADATNTVVVDGSSKEYNKVKYENRLKTGGEGTDTYRSIRFTTSDAATIEMVAVSSNSKESRVLGISDGTKDDNGKLVDIATVNVGTSLALCKLAFPSAGTYYLHSTSGGINFYNIEVKYKTEGTGSDREDDEVREQAADYKSGDLYVSAKGKSGATGSFEDPMDLVTALNSVKPGNTIWMFAGTYYAYDMYEEPIIIAENNSGSAGAYKKVSSINGKTVTIDFDGMAEEGSNRGITLDGSYWHFYDIDICNAGDNGMLLSGDHNIIEMCQFYGNHDTGLQLSRYNTNYATVDLWPSYNTILNCSAFNNKDEATAENADGFAAKLTCGEGNVFDGCMSYCNSDDGWDLYAKPATGPIGVVTIRNCVAFGNGKLTDGTGSANGDMNGFKLGGSNGACPTPHIVENCVAFYNGATGFTDNGNGGAVKMSNCTAYGNGVYDSNKANYMCYRTSKDAVYKNLLSCVTSKGASTDQFLGVLNNVLYSYKNSGYYWVNNWTCTDGAKTKYSGTEAKDYSVSSSDFVNITVPGYNSSTGEYTADYHKIFRNADGSVNLNGLFEVKKTSKLYTAGADGKHIGASFSVKASDVPGETPTETPTEKPTEKPTQAPTEKPTEKPTQAPTEKPTEAPTEVPTEAPTEKPTQTPVETPTVSIGGKIYKAEKNDVRITDIPEKVLKEINCGSVAEVIKYMKDEVIKSPQAVKVLQGINRKDTSVLDITIKIKNTNGQWVKATKDNFPATGMDVIIPYPEGVSPDGKDFVVGHLVSEGFNGIQAGTMEYFQPEKTDKGLKIHIYSASPFIVAWKQADNGSQDIEYIGDDNNDNVLVAAQSEDTKTVSLVSAQPQQGDKSVKTSDDIPNRFILFAAIFIISGFAFLLCLTKRKMNE